MVCTICMVVFHFVWLTTAVSYWAFCSKVLVYFYNLPVFYYMKVSTKRPLPENSDSNCSLTTKPVRAPWSGFSRHQWLNCRRLLACSLSVPFASRVYLCIVVWFVLSMTATVFASVHAIIWISKLYYFVRHAAYTCHDLIIKQHKPSALTWTFNGVSFASCQQRCVWCVSDSITILAHPRSSCLPQFSVCFPHKATL